MSLQQELFTCSSEHSNPVRTKPQLFICVQHHNVAGPRVAAHNNILDFDFVVFLSIYCSHYLNVMIPEPWDLSRTRSAKEIHAAGEEAHC